MWPKPVQRVKTLTFYKSTHKSEYPFETMTHCKLNTYDNIFSKLCHMKNVAQTITNIVWPEYYKSNKSPNILSKT